MSVKAESDEKHVNASSEALSHVSKLKRIENCGGYGMFYSRAAVARRVQSLFGSKRRTLEYAA